MCICAVPGPKNPDNTIVVQNEKPEKWSGRLFDIGLYKNHRLLTVYKNVDVGNQVDLMLQPKLLFAVVRNMYVGKVFTTLEMTTSMTEFDLTNYPDGLVVTLTAEGGSGEYVFTGSGLMEQ